MITVYHNGTPVEVDFDINREDADLFNFEGSKFVFSIDRLKQKKLREIDRIYNDYILNLYPTETQLEMTMYFLSLIEKELSEKKLLSPDEISEKTNMKSLHAWFKSIKVKKQADKDYINAETDIEKIKNFVVVPE